MERKPEDALRQTLRARGQARVGGGPSRHGGRGPRAPAGQRELRDSHRRPASVDLTRQEAVERWMSEARPQAVFVAAAKVGGILANDSYPAEFLYDNLMIEANIIHAAWQDRRREAAVPRLLVHLSQARAPADHRGCTSDGSARADQRVVRDRQDRRHQAGPGLPQAIRLRLHLGDADQPLWARRQLRSADQPRAAGAHPQGARGQDAGRAGDRRSGVRAHRGASSCTSTTAPTRWCIS